VGPQSDQNQPLDHFGNCGEVRYRPVLCPDWASSTVPVLKAAGNRHSLNDKFAMCGAKTSTDERNRVDGSTSVGDGLRHVVVSNLRTSSAVVSDSWATVCRRPQ